jgi:hypothetical protein
MFVICLLVFWLYCLRKSESLLLETSVESLYYDYTMTTRRTLFRSLDYSDKVLDTMASLLSLKKYQLHRDYQMIKLSNEQSEALFERFFPFSELHPLMLPFRLVNANSRLVQRVAPQLKFYNPGVINLYPNNRNCFSAAQMRDILTILGPHPEYCGEYHVLLLARSISPHRSWELYSNVLGRYVPEQEYCVYEVIAYIYRNIVDHRQLARPQLSYHLFDTDFLYNCVEEFLGSSNWQHYYKRILDHLRTVSRSLDPVRRSLWHGKLLYIAMNRVDKCGSLSSINEKTLLVLRAPIINFLTEHEVDDIPPFIMKQILQWTHKKRLFIGYTGNRGFEEAVKRLNILYPVFSSLGGQLSDYVSAWRFYLHTVGGGTLAIPNGPQNLSALISWWGSYGRLGNRILVNPTFKKHILISWPDGRIVECLTIWCFLENFTQMLWSDPGIFVGTGQFRRLALTAHQEDPVLWKAIARTVASNILYRGYVGFWVTSHQFGWLRGTMEPSDPSNCWILFDQISNTQLNRYVPIEQILLKNLEALQSESLIDGPDEMTCRPSLTCNGELGVLIVIISALLIMTSAAVLIIFAAFSN